MSEPLSKVFGLEYPDYDKLSLTDIGLGYIIALNDLDQYKPDVDELTKLALEYCNKWYPDNFEERNQKLGTLIGFIDEEVIPKMNKWIKKG